MYVFSLVKFWGIYTLRSFFLAKILGKHNLIKNDRVMAVCNCSV